MMRTNDMVVIVGLIAIGVGIWTGNASLLGLVAMVIIIGLAIFYIRNMDYIRNMGGGGGQ